MIHDTIQQADNNLPLVSVIIPIYNTQDFIFTCLKSVLNQTYSNIEIICINDGSTDASRQIVQWFIRYNSNIQLIDIENHGQGYARNLALSFAKGEYIIFLDADDYIEEVTLDLAVTRAEEDKSDLVVFDWRYLNSSDQSQNYCNHDAFFSKAILLDFECLELLKIDPIYTVNKLYKKAFLFEHNIRYGEGYLYEDNPFWINVAIHARKVSLIHSPLYRITGHKASSTQQGHTSDKHYKSFIRAVSESIGLLQPLTGTEYIDIRYTIVENFLNRFFFYYRTRIPQSLQLPFLREFIDALSEFDFVCYEENRLLAFICAKNIFKHKHYFIFKLLTNYVNLYKPFFNRLITKITKTIRKLKQKFVTAIGKIIPSSRPIQTSIQKYNAYLRQPIYEDVVLFMGFDFRYTGNTRYLFEEILSLEKALTKKVFFVTNNPLVPMQNRIAPGTDRANRFIARSKVLIFESYPTKYTKRAGTTWIMLWHGTPLKKMLFDASEPLVYSNHPYHKIGKFKDIIRWDYLITDNPNTNSYFQTCFLLQANQLLAYGYPRVKYLIEHVNDKNYILTLKKEYGLPLDKKIVLYVPTWRDYNFDKSEDLYDTTYMLDIDVLQSKLGDDYIVISKNHVYLSKESDKSADYCRIETQELLLTADYIISDYSSIIFDAFAIEKPVLLYCTDFVKNEKARGVYPSMWKYLIKYACYNTDEVCNLINEYRVDNNYKLVKSLFCYKPDRSDLVQFIFSL